MGPRFKPVDREQGLLLPYDLRDWIPSNDIVHFTIEAAELVPVERFNVNENGTGDEQYHPHMLLALLLYCYSHGVFSSRRIERATYTDVAVRYICANKHPDHDTICTFRVRNKDAVAEAFLQILLLAKEMNILKVGTVSVDGSKIKANASMHKSIRYDRAGELEQELNLEIAELLTKAESEDKVKDERGDDLDPELERLTILRAKMRKAQETIEERTRERARLEQEEYERKVRERNDKPKGHKGPPIKKPDEEPRETEQANLTDPDSRIMRKSRRSEYTQSYNAQAVVDAEGTMLVLGACVTNRTCDANELVVDLASIPKELGVPTRVLADNGFANEKPVKALQTAGIEVLIPISSESTWQERRHDFRPKRAKAINPVKETPRQLMWIKAMAETMKTDEARHQYRLRKQSVEPVFGIVKQAMGFRQFLLRGMEKVDLEWRLVLCAYNLKRLAALRE
jgi:transposase